MATIRKHGTKWQAIVRRSGHAPATRSFILKSDAQAWARSMELELDRSWDTNAHERERLKALNTTTLGDLIKRYLEEVVPRKKGHETESIVLNAFVRDHGASLCTIKLSEIHRARDGFIQYRDARLNDDGVAPATLKRQICILAHMFNIAMHEWRIPLKENPLSKLSMPSIKNRRERRLSEHEETSIRLAISKGSRNSLILPLFDFALETAMRRGEILNALVCHLEARRGLLHIPETKTGYARTIPLSDKALAIAMDQARSSTGAMDPNARLFPITGNALRLSWERITKRAGIENLHFHDLRHEAISRLFEKGLSMPEVSLISGHRDPRMLFRYTHPDAVKVRTKMAA